MSEESEEADYGMGGWGGNGWMAWRCRQCGQVLGVLEEGGVWLSLVAWTDKRMRVRCRQCRRWQTWYPGEEK